MKDSNNLLIGILIAVVVFLVLGVSGFGGMMGGYGMMGNWSYGFGGMWVFGWLFMTLVLIALILFIIWLVNQLQKENHRR